MKQKMVKVSYPHFEAMIDYDKLVKVTEKNGFKICNCGEEDDLREYAKTPDCRFFISNSHGTFLLQRSGYVGLMYEGCDQTGIWNIVSEMSNDELINDVKFEDIEVEF